KGEACGIGGVGEGFAGGEAKEEILEEIRGDIAAERKAREGGVEARPVRVEEGSKWVMTIGQGVAPMCDGRSYYIDAREVWAQMRVCGNVEIAMCDGCGWVKKG